jgi:hypothetical protein
VNKVELLETVLLGINAYQMYRACSRGGRCGVAVAVFLINVFTYIANRAQVDESVVSLAVAVAVLVALMVIAER